MANADNKDFESILTKINNREKAAGRRLFIYVLAALSLTIILLGYNYNVTTRIVDKRAKLIDLDKELKRARAEYTQLKASAESLYSVKVTPENKVYEVKATARATGKNRPNGDPLYNFSIYINSPQYVLDEIAKVTYDFNHPTFKKPHDESTNAEERFKTRYTGWGCLSNVTVTVHLKEGVTQAMDFNMCVSIGWQVREKT